MSTPGSAPGTIDVGEVIDTSPVRPLHYGIFTLCALCMIMDGFDVQALGFVAPAIIGEWKIAPSALGPVFAASNFGVLVGQLTFTMLADKIGRRPVLIAGTIAFSMLVILTGMVNTIPQLLVMRFVAGTALGSIIPNATALIGEFSPRAVRIRLLVYIGIGFTLGAAIGGFVAAWMIPVFGWRWVFYFGGGVPLIIAAMMWVWLPESLTLLVVRNKNLDYVAKWVKKLRPTVQLSSSTRFVVKEESRKGVPVMHIFRDGRGLATVMLWVVFFMNLFNLYSLASWVPTVVTGAGYSTRTAVLVGTMIQVGGTISPFLMAWLVMRSGFIPVLTCAFVMAAVSIGAIGQIINVSLALLVVAVTIAGACITGSQPSLNALGATFYPTYLRSTGLGWALGIGRAGSIVGPYMAGKFLAWEWTSQQIFMALTVPAITSAIMIFMLQFAMGTSTAARPQVEASAPVH